MQFETDIQPRLAAGETPQQIAEAINTERRAKPDNYRAVRATEYANWLGTDGRRSRITRAVKALTTQSAIPQETRDALQSAWDTMLALSVNPESTLRIAPGEPHRLLIESAIAAGVMLQSELDALDTIAYVGVSETAETVQAAIDQHSTLVARVDRAFRAAYVFADDNPQSDWASVVAVFNSTE